MLHECTLGHNHNVTHAEYGDGRRAPGDSKLLIIIIIIISTFINSASIYQNVGQRETDIRSMMH